MIVIHTLSFGLGMIAGAVLAWLVVLANEKPMGACHPKGRESREGAGRHGAASELP